MTAPVDDAPVRWGTPVARGVLATTILGSGMAMIDGTIVNVALPKIGAELHVPMAGLQWIINGYMLSLAALILVAGSLGDRYGRRKMFVLGVLWFGAASVLCGAAPNALTLIIARVLQGVGGALLTPGSLAILQSSFAREERARAIGAWSGLGGVASAIGPLLGGLLVQAWSWRLAFLVNVPIAIIVVVLARKFVPESCDRQLQPGHPDVFGSALGALGLAGVTAALVEGPVRGFDPLVVGCAVLGVLALWLFVALQRHSHDPLVPPLLFRDRTFVLSNALTLVVYAALGGVMMLFVLQLQVSLKFGPTAAGVASLPITVIMLLLSARSGKLAQRYGPKWFLVVGPLVVACGMVLMLRVAPGATYVGAVLPAIVVFGLGLAIVVAPVTATVLAAAPDRYAGVASGVNNAVARAGSLLAVAVLPAVAGLSGSAYADPVALTAGWRMACWVCAGLTAVGGVIALGVRNDVLAAAKSAPADVAAPADSTLAESTPAGSSHPKPGDCFTCGVEAPPTHIRPDRERAA
ncbi:MFS transporter [Labedaea rhizosphaerae]|uniref:EmrB/QacA subfamily drug resistance transporter n=1 Tax=Labedaea rhizosphaerae TaxID=598644 RepID=A0A4R6SN60_LABRH|nr:MFS transporter [Labedaea rhizosphaerae]TDQ04633.1 EmrB/QacA subfamily drug resistance transporter [Labedaea rhizosphaerae]